MNDDMIDRLLNMCGGMEAAMQDLNWLNAVKRTFVDFDHLMEELEEIHDSHCYVGQEAVEVFNVCAHCYFICQFVPHTNINAGHQRGIESCFS